MKSTNIINGNIAQGNIIAQSWSFKLNSLQLKAHHSATGKQVIKFTRNIKKSKVKLIHGP